MGTPFLAMFIAFTSLLFTSTSSSPSPSSIYDALSSNGLPIGLLPKGITNFTIDPSTGRFEVYLNKTCHTKFETTVRFDWNFSGSLSYGEISNLSGITAQDLFLWFPVKGIRVEVPTSGIIYFDVGVVFKQFAVSSFENPRDCTELEETPGSDIDLVVLKNRSPVLQNQTRKLLKPRNERVELRAVA